MASGYREQYDRASRYLRRLTDPISSGRRVRNCPASRDGADPIREFEVVAGAHPCYERLLSSSNSPVWYLRVDSRIRTS